MTGCIEPLSWVIQLSVTQAQERYIQYIQTILRYLIQSNFDAIIFCENSEYPIPDADLLKRVATLWGKKLEILQFTGDQEKTLQHGRGFWDNEIINYAINHSLILAQHQTFYKVTGRYRIENINSILTHQKDRKNVFFRTSILDRTSCNTAFFKTNVSFFKKHLQDAWMEVQDSLWKSHYLEHIYYQRLKGQNIHGFTELPHFIGIAGAGWRLEMQPFLLLCKELCNKLWLHNL